LNPKITVTELKRRQNEEDETSVYLYPRSVLLQKPAKTLNAAQIGSLYHAVMQNIEIQKEMDEADIKAQIEKMVAERRLTETEARAVRPAKIRAFFDSPLGAALKTASAVRREVKFGIFIGAAQTDARLEGKTDAKILLQGVIDCVFEKDGRLFILDYKTDRTGTPEEIQKKYAPQLYFYEIAAKRLFGKKPERSYLYLFSADRVL
jgi:ATP-dependent helicase/nuclease subunit A